MATTKNENERQRFPELKLKDGTNNYGAWAVKAKYRLTNLKLWDYVAVQSF